MKKYTLTLILGLLMANTFFAQVTTLATISPNYGDGMIMSPDGNILVSGGWDKNNILEITLDGGVSEYATGFIGPVGMGFDTNGNLYVANYSGNSISKVAPGGTITEFASGLDGPAGLIVSENDEIFVTLYGAGFSGTGSTLLKFDLDGTSEVYANGSGILDAIGLTIDENQDLFVTNFVGGEIYNVDSGQNIGSLATITGAQINQIVYSNEHVFIPSPNLRKIYRVNTNDGTVEHIAGSGGNSTTDGELLVAEFNSPSSCTVNAAGDTLYILDGQVGLIRAVNLETLGVNDFEEGGNGFELEQNFPNPYSDKTNISFSLSNTESVSLTVYDEQGKKVNELLVNKVLNPGKHSYTFDANISSGLYYYTLLVGQHKVTRKMILK